MQCRLNKWACWAVALEPDEHRGPMLIKITCSSFIWIYTWHYLFHCLGIPISEFTQWHYLFHCLGIPISEFTQWHYLFHCLGIPISEFTQWHYLFLCLGIPISEFTQSDLAANSVCYLHTSTEVNKFEHSYHKMFKKMYIKMIFSSKYIIFSN
jgi:hypothetical protein